MIPQPCPYCGNDKVIIDEIIDNDNRKVCAVACPVCGMCGPVSIDYIEEEAVKGWNYLCGRICRNCRQIYIKRIIELKQQLKEFMFENKK